MSRTWSEDLTEAPLRYPAGKCTECACPLSMYNAYVICGPCRVTVVANLSALAAEAERHADSNNRSTEAYQWERFKKRKALPPDLETVIVTACDIDGCVVGDGDRCGVCGRFVVVHEPDAIEMLMEPAA